MQDKIGIDTLIAIAEEELAKIEALLCGFNKGFVWLKCIKMILSFSSGSIVLNFSMLSIIKGCGIPEMSRLLISQLM